MFILYGENNNDRNVTMKISYAEHILNCIFAF